MAALSFSASAAEFLQSASSASALYVVAPKAALADGSAFALLAGSALPVAAAFGEGGVGAALAASAGASVNGSMTSSTVVGFGSALQTLGVVALPDESSRYYSPTQSMAVTGGLKGVGGGDGTAAVLVVLADAEYALPAVRGVARALPRYSRKTGGGTSREVAVGVCTVAAPAAVLPPPATWALAAAAVRNTARINDTPTADMNTAEVEEEARTALAGVPNVTVESIVGDELLENGLGAIHAVGRTSLSPPRLVVLTLTPSDPAAAAKPPIALVGKGIVYDTGGLNLKGNGGRGMKDDMSGAGAVLGAFQFLATAAAAGSELSAPLVAALCLAENSIGPDSYRPDDILTMHSGKTVEVGNTDAEGRFVIGVRARCPHQPALLLLLLLLLTTLVPRIAQRPALSTCLLARVRLHRCLAQDGCSWCARELGAKIVIDAATLTGHSSFTGKTHAAAMASDGALEELAIAAGLSSGEHVVPMVFLPEAQVTHHEPVLLSELWNNAEKAR